MSGGPYVGITSQTGLAFTNTGLANGTTYYYVVSATNAAGESANSIEVNALPPPSLSPVSLTYTNSVGGLQMAWPSDHIGWRLLAQTNAISFGLGTNWVEVFGASATNQIFIPVNPTNGSVFFRLIYP